MNDELIVKFAKWIANTYGTELSKTDSFHYMHIDFQRGVLERFFREDGYHIKVEPVIPQSGLFRGEDMYIVRVNGSLLATKEKSTYWKEYDHAWEAGRRKVVKYMNSDLK